MGSPLNKLSSFSEPDKEEDSQERSSTDTIDFTISAKNPRRTVNQVKNHPLSRLTWETVLSCQRWSETLSAFTVVRSSTQSKSSSTWSADIWANFHCHTSQQDTVRPVLVPPRVQLTPPSSDFIKTYLFNQLIILSAFLFTIKIKKSIRKWKLWKNIILLGSVCWRIRGNLDDAMVEESISRKATTVCERFKLDEDRLSLRDCDEFLIDLMFEDSGL